MSGKISQKSVDATSKSDPELFRFSPNYNTFFTFSIIYLHIHIAIILTSLLVIVQFACLSLPVDPVTFTRDLRCSLNELGSSLRNSGHQRHGFGVGQEDSVGQCHGFSVGHEDSIFLSAGGRVRLGGLVLLGWGLIAYGSALFDWFDWRSSGGRF
jgi:hypothetical protein